MILRRVGPMSAAKVAGFLYAVVGLFIGAIVALISMTVGSAAMGQSSLPFAGLGALSIIIFPICYGIIGFVMTLISAAVYNWAAGIVGGVHLDLQ
jgi:hypothetical protein